MSSEELSPIDIQSKNLDNLQQCAEMLADWILNRRITLATQSALSEMIEEESDVVNLNTRRLDSQGIQIINETNNTLINIVKLINEQKDACLLLSIV